MRVSDYGGGMADWLENGGDVESSSRRRRIRKGATGGAAPPAENGITGPERATAAATFSDRLVDTLILDRSIGGLLGIWLLIVVAFGIVYWVDNFFGATWITSDSAAPAGGFADLLNALYFSFVTALTIGYGDISPLGPARVLAIVEGAAGLLVFGLIISKVVSRRQEELLEDTHRIAFEQRLGRIRTSLHLVLSELQSITRICSEGTAPVGRVRIRAESTIAIFEGELQTVHDLLYRPDQMPDEQVLESILASLAASLEVLSELTACMPKEGRESRLFQRGLRRVHMRAIGICADCVPHQYASELSEWMDRVKAQAEKLGRQAAASG